MNKICFFPGCNSPQHSKGLCRGHYQQQYNGKELTPINGRGRKKIWGDIDCEVKSCSNKAVTVGLCYRCYKRLRDLDISREELVKLPGQCEVCGDSKRTHLDHSHITNKVRGVLCHGCNIAIGMVKENTETLAKLINYLEKHSE